MEPSIEPKDARQLVPLLMVACLVAFALGLFFNVTQEQRRDPPWPAPLVRPMPPLPEPTPPIPQPPALPPRIRLPQAVTVLCPHCGSPVTVFPHQMRPGDLGDLPPGASKDESSKDEAAGPPK